jgi:hypothetical protein
MVVYVPRHQTRIMIDLLIELHAKTIFSVTFFTLSCWMQDLDVLTQDLFHHRGPRTTKHQEGCVMSV